MSTLQLTTAKRILDEAKEERRHRFANQISTKEVAHHLDAVVELLEDKGWVRDYSDGESEFPKLPDLPPVFSPRAVGQVVYAIVVAMYDYVREILAEDDPSTLRSALCEVCGTGTLSWLVDEYLDAVLSSSTNGQWSTYKTWSVRKGRTKAEVIELLNAAAELARSY